MPKQTKSNPTFTVQQSTLNKALSICSKALSDGKIIPINEMFLFNITPGNVEISACDMRIVISTSCDIQTSITNYLICIPGRKLQDYIAKSVNELLLFEIEKDVIPEERETVIHPVSNEPYERITPEQVSYHILIKGTHGKCSIPCEAGEDFPHIANNEPQDFKLPADSFLSMLNKTMFAISEDQLRPAATGLNFRIEAGKVTCTALNFDLVSTYTAPSELDFDANFIIPKKALQQIQALAPTGELELSISKSALSINWGLIKTTLLLIDEKYPDYLSITPTENHIDFVTSRSALINSLKRILPFSDMGKLIKLNISQFALLLTAENIDFSQEASETIHGAMANGEPILIGVNGEYLLDILNSMSIDEVWFSFSEPKRAMIITDGVRHINPYKENICLLMPLFFMV